MNLENPYAIPSLLSTVCFVLLTVYVLYHNPKRTQNRVTAIMFLALIIWSLGETLERFSGPDPETLKSYWDAWSATHTGTPDYGWHEYGLALFWGKFLSIGVLLLGPATLHFSLVVPRKKKVPVWVLPVVYASFCA